MTTKAAEEEKASSSRRPKKGEDHSLDLEGAAHWPKWRSIDHISAIEIPEDFSATDEDGVAHTGLAGDFLVVDRKGKVRVIAGETFHQNFKPLTPAKT